LKLELHRFPHLCGSLWVTTFGLHWQRDTRASSALLAAQAILPPQRILPGRASALAEEAVRVQSFLGLDTGVPALGLGPLSSVGSLRPADQQLRAIAGVPQADNQSACKSRRRIKFLAGIQSHAHTHPHDCPAHRSPCPLNTCELMAMHGCFVRGLCGSPRLPFCKESVRKASHMDCRLHSLVIHSHGGQRDPDDRYAEEPGACER